MWSWSRKKQNEAKYVEVDVRRLIELEAKMDRAETNINSIRGLLNRKLGNHPVEDEPEEYKKDDGLDSLRRASRGQESTNKIGI